MLAQLKADILRLTTSLYQSSVDRLMRICTGSRKGGAFFVSLCKLDYTANRHTAVHAGRYYRGDTPLYRGSKAPANNVNMVARHGGNARDDALHNSVLGDWDAKCFLIIVQDLVYWHKTINSLVQWTVNQRFRHRR